MHTIDHRILEHCSDDFRPLKPLRAHIPQGTLYRHINTLLRLGWLERESGLYRTTKTGNRQLLETETIHQWDRLEKVYPPLRLIPTAVHRALVELILAAVVARQHPTRPDRHPVFIAYGQTLRWKTSLGLFMCHALGLDPATYCIECASESGKSLFVRRGGSGQISFKRTVLDAPFLLLDEYLDTDPSVRATLKLFLRGRLTIPLDNGTVTIRPVPLLTLNPRRKTTLEAQLGLSAPEIRRAIVTNFDAVALPDLATTGERALAAAKAHGPITLGPPAADCSPYLTALVQLVRAILIDEAQERVDVHVIANLCSGMTAFLPEPLEAMVQVGHGLGLLAETMGWARPGWVAALADFSLEPRPCAVSSPAEAHRAHAVVETTPQPHAMAAVSPPLALQVSRTPREQHPAIPAVSQTVRDRMTWLAVETGQSLDETFLMLIDLYLLHRDGPHTIPILRQILTLAEHLKVAELDMNDVREFLALRARLGRYQCDFLDVPEALRLIDCLSALPQSWTWKQVKYVVNVMAVLLQENISADKVATFIVRHRQLERHGFNEGTVEAVLKALQEAGAVGRRRATVIARLVDLANQQVHVEDLECAREQKEAQVQNLAQKIREAKGRLASLQQEATKVTQHLQRCNDEYQKKSSQLEVLVGVKNFLLGRLSADDPLWERLERTLRMGRRGELSNEQTQQIMTTHIVTKFGEFVAQVSAEAQGGQLG